MKNQIAYLVALGAMSAALLRCGGLVDASTHSGWVAVGGAVAGGAISVGGYGDAGLPAVTAGAQSATPPGTISCSTLNCNSTADNNCNGIADNEELACITCDPSAGLTRSCDLHPGFDGVGTCRAGFQKCIPVGSPGAGGWGECQAGVGPSFEACGPTSPDTNCSGVAGDGAGCTKVIKLFGNMSPAACTNDGVLGNTSSSTYGQVVAADVSPGPSWAEISTFLVFVEPSSGTLPLRNCRTAWGPGNSWFKYVQVGDSCSNLDNSQPWQEVEIVGYISAIPASGYSRLNQVTLRYSYYYADGMVDLARVPVLGCPWNCKCTPADWWVE